MGRRRRFRIGFVGIEDGFNVLVDAISSKTDARTADDLVCIGGEDTEGKFVANILGEAYKEAFTFGDIGRKGRFLDSVINRGTIRHDINDARVGGFTLKSFIRCAPIKVGASDSVVDVHDIISDEQPFIPIGTGAFLDEIHGTLEILPTSFSEVLVMEMGFALVITDLVFS